MTALLEDLRRPIDDVLARHERFVAEPEGLPLLRALGFACPRSVTLTDPDAVTPALMEPFVGDVVVKIASSEVLHRSDGGGVAMVNATVPAVREALASMQRRFSHVTAPRFTINERIVHHEGPGGELLLGLRYTHEFGPVVVLGSGGVFAETFGHDLRPGAALAVWSVEDLDRRAIVRRLEGLSFVRAVTGGLRGQPRRLSSETLVGAIESMATLGRLACPMPIVECEINPLAVTDRGIVALDVLIEVGHEAPRVRAPRPLQKLARLLEPHDVAIVGVSEQMNPGHVILRNLLERGFPANRTHLVRRDRGAIDGCTAYGDLSELPATVDLLVLAVASDQVPALLSDVIEHRRAESVIVIPGGLEEKAGGRAAMAPVHAALERARESEWQGPVINGGNCLGIRSVPGGYDTMFIPSYKLPSVAGPVSPVALVSQSGALALTLLSRCHGFNPKYAITVGNQMDLTIGDYLTWLAADESLRVFAVYVEGFQPHDGTAFLRAARTIVQSGRRVVLYRAARTRESAAVSASHSASLAGDYTTTRELSEAEGIDVVETLDDFEDVVKLATAFADRGPVGPGLGVASNAGFECVVAADTLGPFHLPVPSRQTVDRLTTLLARRHIERMVDVHNPLDLTPMADDEVFGESVATLLDDSSIDVAVVGCVPLTPALSTLPYAASHGENLLDGASVVSRLRTLWLQSRKPCVLVVDAGTQYDAMVSELAGAGLPVFRAADRALRALSRMHRARAPD
ncbi:MAG: acetate--CoA ligase family protein [Vicinamibacterales bacterium]